MLLIVWYVVFMIVGDLAACLIGLGVERRFGSHASLVTFLVFYFMFLWVSWILAVRVTARRLGLRRSRRRVPVTMMSHPESGAFDCNIASGAGAYSSASRSMAARFSRQ